MDLLNQIIENPLYIFLFGGGGTLVIILNIISLKRKKDKNINVKIDISSNHKQYTEAEPEEKKKYNLEFSSNPIIDKSEEYEQLDFSSDEYYITFLKTIEEKKKGGDKFEYE